MTIKVGINGFGRIGRTVFRILAERDDIQVVAINDLYDNDQLLYLLQYDTVMGKFAREATADADHLYLEGRKIEIELMNGSRVRVGEGFSAEELGRVLDVLQGRA